MANKTKASKTRFHVVKGSKAAKKKASKPAARKAAPKPPKRAPRQPALGGIGELRIKPLDRVCVAIAEVRVDINSLRGEEAGLLRQALAEMRAAKKQTYRHAGVELARVPGEERLRVRTTKGEDATAETDEPEEQVDEVEPETDDAGNPEPHDLGEGQGDGSDDPLPF